MTTNARKRVLIVEDNELIRSLLQLQLTGFILKLEVWEATDGEAGLHRARLLLPDIIITDLDMPQMDGLELIRTLRQEPHRKLKTTPISATTGTNPEWRERARAAGANFVLEKPIYKRDLVSAMLMLLTESTEK